MIYRICSVICGVLWITDIFDVGLRLGAWQTASLMAKSSLMFSIPVFLFMHRYYEKRENTLIKLLGEIRDERKETDDITETRI